MEGLINDDQQKGIIPRVINGLFDAVTIKSRNATDAKTNKKTQEFLIRVSFVEIYMERIRDLLVSTKNGKYVEKSYIDPFNLQMHENKVKGVYIEGVIEKTVSTVQELLQIMSFGKMMKCSCFVYLIGGCCYIGAINRAIGATAMNEGSSRSHSVFTVTVEQKDSSTDSIKYGKLVLVDLAGSEMIGKSNVVGLQQSEAIMINKSLSALGNVINALTDDTIGFVPYRNSKLTRLLQNSLGGNSKTVLIIAISPASYNFNETVSTLRFGSRAKRITNKVTINETKSANELEALLQAARQTIERQTAMINNLQTQTGGPGGALLSRSNSRFSPNGKSSLSISISGSDDFTSSQDAPSPSTILRSFTDENNVQQEGEKKAMQAQIDEYEELIDSLTKDLETYKLESLDWKRKFEVVEEEKANSMSELSQFQNVAGNRGSFNGSSPTAIMKRLEQSLQEEKLKYSQLSAEHDMLHNEKHQLLKDLYVERERVQASKSEAEKIKQERERITTRFQTEQKEARGKLQEEITTLQERVQQLQKDQSMFKEKEAHENEVFVASQQELLVLREQVQSLEKAKLQLTNNVERSNAESNILSGKVTQLEVEIHTLQTQTTQLHKEKRELETNKAMTELKLAQLETGLHAMTVAKNAKDEECIMIHKKVKQLEDEHVVVKQKATSTDHQLNSLQKELQDAKHVATVEQTKATQLQELVNKKELLLQTFENQVKDLQNLQKQSESQQLQAYYHREEVLRHEFDEKYQTLKSKYDDLLDDYHGKDALMTAMEAKSTQYEIQLMEKEADWQNLQKSLQHSLDSTEKKLSIFENLSSKTMKRWKRRGKQMQTMQHILTKYRKAFKETSNQLIRQTKDNMEMQNLVTDYQTTLKDLTSKNSSLELELATFQNTRMSQEEAMQTVYHEETHQLRERLKKMEVEYHTLQAMHQTILLSQGEMRYQVDMFTKEIHRWKHAYETLQNDFSKEQQTNAKLTETLESQQIIMKKYLSVLHRESEIDMLKTRFNIIIDLVEKARDRKTLVEKLLSTATSNENIVRVRDLKKKHPEEFEKLLQLTEARVDRVTIARLFP